jgi:hypothetical protein
MNLSAAQKKLSEDGVSDHHRYFMDTYQIHDFKEETPLKEYIDFIMHEPLLWLQLFPAKLKSKPAFSKPKTALLKLLRDPAVIAVLGSEYANSAHDLIDKTYKQHHVEIIAKRMGGSGGSAAVAPDVVVTKEETLSTTLQIEGRQHGEVDDDAAAADVETLECSDGGVAEELRDLQKKYRVLKKAFEVMVTANLSEGNAKSITILLSLL